MSKKTDEALQNQVKGIVQSFRAMSENYLDQSIATERVKTLKYYRGDKTIVPYKENRTKITSRDVADVIEAAMPDFMEVLFGNAQIGKFNPIVNREDLSLTSQERAALVANVKDPAQLAEIEKQYKIVQIQRLEKVADQATKFCDYVIKKQNDGFRIFYDTIKDALMVKNGFVRLYWCEENEYNDESYEGLDELEYQALLADNNVEKVEESEVDGKKRYKAKRKNKKKYIKIETALPEYIYTDPFAATVQDCRYFEHVMFKSRSELIEEGFDEQQINDLAASTLNASKNTVGIERYKYQNQQASGTNNSDSSGDILEIRMCYIKADLNDDGIAELTEVVLAGNSSSQILKKNGKLAVQEVDCIPYETCVAIFEPHQLIGNALADYVKDLQEIKTALQRQMLDNQYMVNNQMLYADINAEVDIDYLLSAGPGSVILGKGQGGVTQIPVQPLGQNSIAMIQYFDTVRDERSGISKYSQGLDSESMANTAASKTAGGMQMMLSRADKRQKLIMRCIAETFVKGLYHQILRLACKHMTESQILQFGNDWVEINPLDWTDKMNFNIEVGSGNMNRQDEIQNLTILKQIQNEGIQYGIVNAENVYNLDKKIVQVLGYNTTDAYFTKPQPNQPIQAPPPAVDPMAELQAKNDELAAKNENIRLNTQLGQLQFNYDKLKADLGVKAAEMEQQRKFKEADLGLDIRKTQLSNHIQMQGLNQDLLNIVANVQQKQQQIRGSTQSE
ncbi:MAG: hypothetical protein EBS06_05385 [Proteobacteria bacterium]|nr:hypothetical protein [Pseudomonadota bacterium]